MNVMGFGDDFNYKTAKDFFLAHLSSSPNTFEVSEIRGYPSRYAPVNNLAVHLPVTLGQVAHCDFVCFENNDEKIFWVGKIVYYEYVNENSTRIHFNLDYWHTWIEFVKFGFSFTQRRHAYDMQVPYRYTAGEPLGAPSIPAAKIADEMDKDVHYYIDDKQFYVYLTGDEYQSYSSASVRLQNKKGMPFWGTVKPFNSIDEVTDYIQTYMDTKGSLSDSAEARLANVERVVHAPTWCMTSEEEGRAVSVQTSHDVKDTHLDFANHRKVKFGKFFLPQFFSGNIIQNGSGNAVVFDWSTCAVRLDGGQYTATITADIQGVGGQYPKIRLAFYSLENKSDENDPHFVQTNTHALPYANFPAIPVNAFLPERPTAWGCVKTFLSHPYEGIGHRAIDMGTEGLREVLTKNANAQMKKGDVYANRADMMLQGFGSGAGLSHRQRAHLADLNFTSHADRFYNDAGRLGALAKGKGVGALVAGAVVAGGTLAAETLLDMTNDASSRSYNVAGSEDEMIVANNLYSLIIQTNMPTWEGSQMIWDFFNHFGYAILRREKLTLKHGDNFTYIKLGSPATQDLQNEKQAIPHTAFNNISALLCTGITVWNVDIGSKETYTDTQRETDTPDGKEGNVNWDIGPIEWGS